MTWASVFGSPSKKAPRVDCEAQEDDVGKEFDFAASTDEAVQLGSMVKTTDEGV